MLPENHAVLPKMSILLIPKVKYIHLDTNLLSFMSLMTNISIFPNFLNPSPSIMIRIPWGIVSLKSGVAKKSCRFTSNANFA